MEDHGQAIPRRRRDLHAHGHDHPDIRTHVYFADAAFRGGDGKLSFRTLEELGAYMERLMHDSDQPEVAKALYGPFYESFRKGIGNVGL